LVKKHKTQPYTIKKTKTKTKHTKKNNKKTKNKNNIEADGDTSDYDLFLFPLYLENKRYNSPCTHYPIMCKTY